MKKVERSELLDFVTYGERRDEIRRQAIAHKRPRRIHVGPHLTLLFETTETMRYQVQEMMRAEQIVKETDIAHELTTYNELLGGPGELGCTLLIEIDNEEERQEKLTAWLGLSAKVYARVPVTSNDASDGGETADDDASSEEKCYATFDPRQVGDDRLSSVQYLKIDTGGRTPLAIGVDHPAYDHEAELDREQAEALAHDLAPK